MVVVQCPSRTGTDTDEMPAAWSQSQNDDRTRMAELEMGLDLEKMVH